MGQKLNFQEIALTLVAFWKSHGCTVLQPHNIQIREGTLNPATALGILGPEPLHVVIVETSVRPRDGRFGHHPNRLQLHHQLQVVLKPDPGNPQELYLKSLEAIGLNLDHYDIRFVEDNWESEILGVWGRGWEVLLNGLEITQFTYLQHAAGMDLDPIPVEITYGIERIALALHNLHTVWQIDVGSGMQYEDLFKSSEVEQCEYYFNVADVESLKLLYKIQEEEIGRCLEAGLVRPAYDLNLKCAHIFNILSARGAVGVAERASCLQQMNGRYEKIAQLHLAQREAAGFPLLVDTKAKGSPEPQVTPSQTPTTVGKQSFILEIGTEELPVFAQQSALNQLRMAMPELLNRLGLSYGRIEVEGTPRRLSVNVHFLAATQEAEEAEETVPLLAKHLPELIDGIQFNRTMRWNASNVYFSRPIRWIVALYGQDLIPFTYAGVPSGRTSRGIRPDGSPDIRISNAYTYAGIIRKSGIILIEEKRIEQIKRISSKLAAEKHGVMDDDPQLMAEVANMVERPTPLRGEFDRGFLSLPKEILVAVMKKRQRYFPIYQEDGNLLPYFLAVRNGDERHLDVVVSGNEKVLNGRFADAQFFYQKDSQYKLEEFLPALKKLTFHPDLGSMAAKVTRLSKLTPIVGKMLHLEDEEIVAATRAAKLSKADLASRIVLEMQTLQGVMGGYYAANSGESTAVSQAISEQYNLVSKTKPGLALAIADAIDSITGLFGVGEAPQESTDPYRLRRTARHLLTNILQNEVELDLRQLVLEAARLQPVSCDSALQEEIIRFLQQIYENLLLEMGHLPEQIETVIGMDGYNPYGQYSELLQLDVNPPHALRKEVE